MLSSFSLLEQICLAPVTYGRFHKEWLERNFRQHAHLIPLYISFTVFFNFSTNFRSLRDLIEEYSIKKSTLPFPKEFPLFLITEMNVPFPVGSNLSYRGSQMRKFVVMGPYEAPKLFKPLSMHGQTPIFGGRREFRAFVSVSRPFLGRFQKFKDLVGEHYRAILMNVAQLDQLIKILNK